MAHVQDLPVFARAQRTGIFRAFRARRELARARRVADRELVRSPHVPLRNVWRAEELSARKNRLSLARSVRDVVRTADARYLPSASPLNRVAARAERSRLLAVAVRLEAVAKPVSPQGVLLADQLLHDSSGPLYARERSAELASYLETVLSALEEPR